MLCGHYSPVTKALRIHDLVRHYIIQPMAYVRSLWESYKNYPRKPYIHHEFHVMFEERINLKESPRNHGIIQQSSTFKVDLDCLLE